MKTIKWLAVVAFTLVAFACYTWNRSVTAQERDPDRVEGQMHELDVRIERAIDDGRMGEAGQLHEQRRALRERAERERAERERAERERAERERESQPRDRGIPRDFDPARHREEMEHRGHELEMRQLEIEVEMAQVKLEHEKMELRSNPMIMAIQAIDVAREKMEPEAARELFNDLLEESKHYPIKLHLRRSLIELNLQLGQREDAIRHLRAMALFSDEH
ncbi:hypothetical protein [Novipirellula artificiosorum]|uniref:Tetratricopeptide repeat protein n=1 Tax=Novipirellula artificiosorum TaxID=2528016 RepID=A0A5C6DGX9_9BACT|nr:hypothetical protein [Novipirellula artificiosorum]TWU35097.1 hypothetical protein Poly41_42410 [Novipirellula artificiosorum]